MAYGYSHLTAHNKTHFEFDFQSDNLAGGVVDNVMFTKQEACTFGVACAEAKAARAKRVKINAAASAEAGSELDGGGGSGVVEDASVSAVDVSTRERMHEIAQARALRIDALRRCWSFTSQSAEQSAQRSRCGLDVLTGAYDIVRDDRRLKEGGHQDGDGSAHSGHSGHSAATATTAATAATATTATTVHGAVPYKSLHTPTRPVPQTQRDLLVRLYNATGGGSWTRNANWLTGDPCDSTAPWYGVGCAVVTDTTLPDIGRGAEYGPSSWLRITCAVRHHLKRWAMRWGIRCSYSTYQVIFVDVLVCAVDPLRLYVRFR
jgi:hypothetical protein